MTAVYHLQDTWLPPLEQYGERYVMATFGIHFTDRQDFQPVCETLEQLRG